MICHKDISQSPTSTWRPTTSNLTQEIRRLFFQSCAATPQTKVHGLKVTVCKLAASDVYHKHMERSYVFNGRGKLALFESLHTVHV